jgi:hypothetical protein
VGTWIVDGLVVVGIRILDRILMVGRNVEGYVIVVELVFGTHNVR